MGCHQVGGCGLATPEEMHQKCYGQPRGGSNADGLWEGWAQDPVRGKLRSEVSTGARARASRALRVGPNTPALSVLGAGLLRSN